MSRSNIYGATGNYEDTKRALERQTAALLAERRQIENINHNQYPPTKLAYPQSASLTPIVHNSSKKEKRTEEVVGKLQQIIKLCRQEGSLSNEEMRQVVKVQSQVLNYLQRTTAEQQPNVIRPISSSDQVVKSKQDAPPTFPSNPAINQTWRKDTNRQILSEDTLEIIGQIERKALGEIIHLQQQKDAIKKQKQQIVIQYEKLRQYVIKLNAGVPASLAPETGDNNQLRQQNKRLRIQNAEMDRIKQQNKILRQENQYLNSRLDAIGNVSSIQGRDTIKYDQRQPQQNIGLVQGQYSSQIAVYENQLKRASVVINELRNKLINVPGLQELHDQGQRIRRQTAELLRFKNSAPGYQGQETSMIRDLQERLQNQQRGKAVFLQELKAFKQKYIQLQEENKYLRKSKVSFDTIPKPSGSTPRPQREVTSPRAGIIKKKNSYLGEYQQTLQDLKHVLY